MSIFSIFKSRDKPRNSTVGQPFALKLDPSTQECYCKTEYALNFNLRYFLCFMSALATIGEDELETATVKAINKAVRYSSSMRDTLRENILKVISEDKTDEIDELRVEKQKILVEIFDDHFKVTFKAGIEVEIKR